MKILRILPLYSVIVTAWTLALSQNASGQEMGFLNAERGNPFSVLYEHTYVGNADSTDSKTTSLSDGRFNINVPLHTRPDLAVFATLKGQRITLSDDLTIPDRNVTIPKDFGGADIGAGFVMHNQEDEQLGFSATIGTTGRQLFDNDNDRAINATFFSEKKYSSGNSLIWVLNYANNRTVLNNIPLPGLAWIIRGKEYTFVLGAPFLFLNWRPMPVMVTVALSPFFINAESSVFIVMPVQAFLGVNWNPRAYQNLAPGSSDDRLFYDKKELSLGLRLPFSKTSFFSVGYVFDFDRRFVIGESLTKTSSQSNWLGDASGVMLRARATF